MTAGPPASPTPDGPRSPAIRAAAGPDDLEAAAEALALAFADDPAWAHLLPGSEEARAERLLAFFTAEIENLVPEHRRVWISEDGAAAAIWAEPRRWRVPFRRTLRPTPRMARVFGRRLPLAVWTQLRFERLHPRQHHWYLHYVGVEPRRQGRGLGGAVLAPVLRRCDREGIPAHLESSKPENVPFYERHGFTVSSDFRMPLGGPRIHEMWRQPHRD